MTQHFFLLLGIVIKDLSFYNIQFSNLKDKELNITSSKVISSHMSPIYIESAK